MHALLLTCLLVGQGPRLDIPPLGVAGQPMVVRAAPTAVPAMHVELLDSVGRRLGTHTADDRGEVTLTIEAPGAYTLRWYAPDGVEVLAPFHMVAPRPSWFSAWWTVPLGLALAWRALRRGLAARGLAGSVRRDV